MRDFLQLLITLYNYKSWCIFPVTFKVVWNYRIIIIHAYSNCQHNHFHKMEFIVLNLVLAYSVFCFHTKTTIVIPRIQVLSMAIHMHFAFIRLLHVLCSYSRFCSSSHLKYTLLVFYVINFPTTVRTFRFTHDLRVR